MNWLYKHPRVADAIFLFDCIAIVAVICAFGWLVGYLAEWFK